MKNEGIYKEGRAYPYHFFCSQLESLKNEEQLNIEARFLKRLAYHLVHI